MMLPFNQSTMHGIMMALMEAYYKDAIQAQNSNAVGIDYDITIGCYATLESTLMTLCEDVKNALSSETLSPFTGDYRTWLNDRGYTNFDIAGNT